MCPKTHVPIRRKSESKVRKFTSLVYVISRSIQLSSSLQRVHGIVNTDTE